MLARAVRSYLALRRAAGFQLHDADLHLRSFASYSDARRRGYIDAHTAIEWARRGGSVVQRARRLGHVFFASLSRNAAACVFRQFASCDRRR
jgi:hypothetical protein